MNVFSSYSEEELRAYQRAVEHEIISRKAIPYTQFTPTRGTHYVFDSCNCYDKGGLFRTSFEQRMAAKKHYYRYKHNLNIFCYFLGKINGSYHYEIRVK